MGGVAAVVGRRERLLRLHEGVRPKPYRDTTGHLTIGVGRNLDAKGLRPDEISLLLANDMAEAERDLLARWPWAARLDAVRYAVLAEMCFNLGPAKLAKFVRTLAAVQRGDYASAAQGMLASLWARQVGTRAGRLALMMRTGQWPPEVA